MTARSSRLSNPVRPHQPGAKTKQMRTDMTDTTATEIAEQYNSYRDEGRGHLYAEIETAMDFEGDVEHDAVFSICEQERYARRKAFQWDDLPPVVRALVIASLATAALGVLVGIFL